MSDDTIRIPIETPANVSGAERAIRALERLQRAEGNVTKEQAALAQAAARLAQADAKTAAAVARTASEQRKAAQDTARRAGAEADTTKKLAAAAIAEQRLQAQIARTAASQDRAAVAALRRAQAEQKAAGSGKGPSFASQIGGEVVGQAAAALGPAAVVAAGAAAVGVGVQAGKDALALEQTTAGLKIASGSLATYNEALAIATRNQILFGGSAQENQAALIGLANISRTSGVALGEIDTVVQQLKASDPAATFEDASIALREFLSGDITSLAERFELPRAKLRELADETVPAQEKIRRLNQMLLEAGYASDTAAAAVPKAAQAYNDLGRRIEQLRLGAGGAAANFFAPIAQSAADVVGVLDNTSESAVKAYEGYRRLTGIYTPLSDAERQFAEWLGAGNDERERAAVASGAYTAAMEGAVAAAQRQAEGAKNSADALAKETEEKLKSAVEADKLAQFQEKLASLGDAVAGGMMTSRDAAAILAAQYGITADEALRLINLQAQLANAKPVDMAQQRMDREERMANGGRGGQTTTAAIDFVRNAQKNAEAAQAARAAAARGAGGGGSSAARKAEAEAKKEAAAAERAAEQADDIQYKQAERQRDILNKRVAAAQDRADKLADIERTAAQDLAQIASDTAARQAEIETQASARLADIRKQRAASLKAIDERAAAEQQQAARDLASTIAGTQAGLRASNAADNLALAGNANDPELQARERAQAAREAATQAAAQRAQGFSDATVGQAAFAAELQALDAKQALDEEYAARQEELAGNPGALAELEAYYQQAVAAQRAAVEQQIADAQQAADLKAAAREQEKLAVIAAAEEERRAVVAERERQQREVVAAAEKQRAEVAAKAAEQRQAVETEFTAQNDAITAWADDTERELQRIIDKADEATRALLAMNAATPKGGGSASGLPPGVSVGTRAGGGPVVAGQPYIVGEQRPELFVPATSGTILPYVPSGAGAGGSSVVFGPGSVVINAAPGMDERYLVERTVIEVERRVRSRGYS